MLARVRLPVAFSVLVLAACAAPPGAAIDAARDDIASDSGSDLTTAPDAPENDLGLPDAAIDDVSPTVVTCASGGSAAPIPDAITQVLLVTTPSWTDAHGNLDRFERQPGGAWTSVGTRIQVSIGRAGLGWGRGLHGAGTPAACDGPTKHEGDGRSPAGVFTLGTVYGDTAGAGSFAYTPLTPSWRCPDDPASAYYNEVLDSNTVTPDWNSAETMLRSDGLYHWVVFVNHNTMPREPGAGSCIFIHVWGGAASTTVGCTSMDGTTLQSVLAWLQPEHAVQVALPATVYSMVRADWQLP